MRGMQPLSLEERLEAAVLCPRCFWSPGLHDHHGVQRVFQGLCAHVQLLLVCRVEQPPRNSKSLSRSPCSSSARFLYGIHGLPLVQTYIHNFHTSARGSRTARNFWRLRGVAKTRENKGRSHMGLGTAGRALRGPSERLPERSGRPRNSPRNGCQSALGAFGTFPRVSRNSFQIKTAALGTAGLLRASICNQTKTLFEKAVRNHSA